MSAPDETRELPWRQWAKRLRSSDVDERRLAAAHLWMRADSAAPAAELAAAWIDALADSDDQVAQTATEALGELARVPNTAVWRMLLTATLSPCDAVAREAGFHFRTVAQRDPVWRGLGWLVRVRRSVGNLLRVTRPTSNLPDAGTQVSPAFAH